MVEIAAYSQAQQPGTERFFSAKATVLFRWERIDPQVGRLSPPLR